MDTILNILAEFARFFRHLVDFVVGFFQDLVYMIKLLGKFILELPMYFSWLPDQLVATLLLIFGIVVIYKILGREG